ncbi:MAG: sodium:panthothenate symporter [Lentisphaeria bacterium]|nr:sodium:panthothenate symporter [Lentisphaeria bacterium]
MTWYAWLIVIIPVIFIMYVGWYIRRFIVGVSDFLVCGRVCRRYVITTAHVASALGLVTLAAYIEVHYRTGFALAFWNSLMLPISVMISLTGYCIYRFRETRSLSIGQFLEMRYSRSLRIFACFLRSIAEMMANIIMPAIAARFFIAFLDLPRSVTIFGKAIPTFLIIVALLLTLAVSLICMGGMLAINITDTIQGLICFPLVVTFIVFVLVKFSWSTEIVQVMSDRVAGESFMNPYDISQLRDFNLFMLFVTFFGMFMHTASALTGNGNSAISAHEAKMGSILGAWRGAFTAIFYLSIAIGIITLMNHTAYAKDAKEIRTDISRNIATELIPDTQERAEFMKTIEAIPPSNHTIGKDAPLSDKKNLDTVYFDTAEKYFGKSGEGSSKTQQYRTLFKQLMLPASMKHMLPPVMAGLFCLMIVIFIISTDDSRIYSASATLVQDCVVPFYKNESLSPEKHIWWIRFISIGVGVFFLIGSYFMSQIDYINMFVSIMYGMWMGGCGPMMIFGFYSRFGTTAGAWASLLSGMFINFSGMICQRTWASTIYPWLERMGWVDSVGNFLSTVSRPFNPYIVWEMNRLKFPINSYEVYFMAMLTSLIVYCAVSALTYRRPFNLDRMLHRGKYAIEGEKKIKSAWTWRSVWGKLIGITPEYTKADKVIAWSVFSYSFIYKFLIAFLLVVILNAISPWPTKWWGHYFLITNLIIPGIAAAITTVWFGIGSTIDLTRMFRDLKNRVSNPLDNGMVTGRVALSEKAQIDAIEAASNKNGSSENKENK